MVFGFDTIIIGIMEGNPMKEFYESPLVTVLQIERSDILTTKSTEQIVEGDVKDLAW